jgi:hypothetical protein
MVNYMAISAEKIYEYGGIKCEKPYMKVFHAAICVDTNMLMRKKMRRKED